MSFPWNMIRCLLTGVLAFTLSDHLNGLQIPWMDTCRVLGWNTMCRIVLKEGTGSGVLFEWMPWIVQICLGIIYLQNSSSTFVYCSWWHWRRRKFAINMRALFIYTGLFDSWGINTKWRIWNFGVELQYITEVRKNKNQSGNKEYILLYNKNMICILHPWTEERKAKDINYTP